MSLAEIKEAVTELSQKELAELTGFLLKHDNVAWDTQMDEDAAAGKLDFLFEEARQARDKGVLKDWPAE